MSFDRKIIFTELYGKGLLRDSGLEGIFFKIY